VVHESRLAEELVLWMSQYFGISDVADRYCTGSSIVPQERNPDVAELARGKSGCVVCHLMGLITLMKGQQLADDQEDKEPLFDTVDTPAGTLRIMAEMVGSSAGGQTGPADGRGPGRPAAGRAERAASTRERRRSGGAHAARLAGLAQRAWRLRACAGDAAQMARHRARLG
jgi:argininosuccinate lyase